MGNRWGRNLVPVMEDNWYHSCCMWNFNFYQHNKHGLKKEIQSTERYTASWTSISWIPYDYIDVSWKFQIYFLYVYWTLRYFKVFSWPHRIRDNEVWLYLYTYNCNLEQKFKLVIFELNWIHLSFRHWLELINPMLSDILIKLETFTTLSLN